MVDNLTTRWGNLTLTEDEGAIEDVPEEEFIEMAGKGRNCLVGKLLSKQNLGKEIIRTKLVRRWKPTGYLTFRALGKNYFLIDFEH